MDVHILLMGRLNVEVDVWYGVEYKKMYFLGVLLLFSLLIFFQDMILNLTIPDFYYFVLDSCVLSILQASSKVKTLHTYLLTKSTAMLLALK